MSVVCLSILMFSFLRSIFIRAEVTLFFVMYWSVRPVLMYYRNPIFALRWVRNLWNLSQVLREESSWYYVHRVLKLRLNFLSEFHKEQKIRGNRCFLSIITSTVSVYALPIGNSLWWLMVVSLIVMEIGGSRSLSVVNIFDVSRGDIQSYLSRSCRIRR